MANKVRPRVGASDIVLMGISTTFLVGISTVFGACGPKDDGSWMTCHWANVSVQGLAAVLLALSVVHLVVRNHHTKVGIDISMMLIAGLAAITPGFLISLCMMNTMQCHVVMRPAALVMSMLVIAAASFDIVYRRSASNTDPIASTTR